MAADGKCYYYCMAAIADLREWAATHDSNGRANTEARAAADLAKANELRRRICDTARSIGNAAAADRLLQEGTEGYPTIDDWEYAAAMLGWKIRRMQLVYKMC